MIRTRNPEVFAVCMAFDAMRLCLGKQPRNFSRDEVIRWLVTDTPPDGRQG